MACEEKQQALQDKLASARDVLAAELKAIESDSESRAKQISDAFEADNDLAAGVGAAAGTVIGLYMGGPVGGAVGNVIGKQIGSLFTLEIGTRQEKVALDIPTAVVKTQDFSFDLPVVQVRDTDISFDVPSIEMKRTRGPDVPRVTVRMETRCVSVLGARVCTDVPVSVTEWDPTWIDVPTPVLKTQHIVIGVPQVTMKRQEFKVDVPQFESRSTEFSVDVPVITLRFIKDAGKRTAAQAAALAQEVQEAILQKQVAFRDRLRNEAAPLATAMFACFRESLTAQRSSAAKMFDDQISTLRNTLVALQAKGVPETDDDYIAALKLLNGANTDRDVALSKFDQALKDLGDSEKKTMEQFLGQAGGIKVQAAPIKSLGLKRVTTEAHSSHGLVPGLVALR